MIISHKHKFIFIKTVKTAGTSLEIFLSQHCGPDDVLSLFDPPIEGHHPRNYEGSGDPLSEILRIPFGPRSAWRCLLARRERFYNHMPFFFSSRRRHTRLQGDWSSDVCSSD